MSPSPVARNSDRLKADEYLPDGRQLISKNGRWVAEVVDNSYLAIRQRGLLDKEGLFWISKPALRHLGAGNAVLVLRSRGNLVLTTDIDARDNFLWETETDRPLHKDPLTLILKDDGTLWLGVESRSDEVWSRRQNVRPFPSPYPFSCALTFFCVLKHDCQLPAAGRKRPSKLEHDEYLTIGQSLVAPNGKTSFSLEETGNLLVRDKDGNSTYYYIGAGSREVKFLTPFRRGWEPMVQILNYIGSQEWPAPVKDDPRGRTGQPALEVRNDGTVAALVRGGTGNTDEWYVYYLARGPEPVAASELKYGKTWKRGTPLVSPLYGEHWLDLDADGTVTWWKNGRKRNEWSPKVKPKATVSATVKDSGLLEISDGFKPPLLTLGIPARNFLRDPVLKVGDSGIFSVVAGGSEIWNSEEISKIRPRL